MVGGKEAVIDGCATLFINPTNEATITVAIFTLKTTVELTVGDGNLGMDYLCYEAGEIFLAATGTSQGDR